MKLFLEVTIPMSTDREFKADFWMMRSTFEKLLNKIGPMFVAPLYTGRKKNNARRQLLTASITFPKNVLAHAREKQIEPCK